MEYKYSIMIPHKNSLDLLKRCLKSILDRSDIQIIVIDDNSDSIDERDFEEVNIQKVKLHLNFTKEGKGAGYARNIGLKIVKGKWLIFADADNFFISRAFDILDRTLSDENEINYYKVSSVYSDTMEKADRDGINRMIDNSDSDLMYLKIKHFVPWGKVFSSEFIRSLSLRFDEVNVSNDIMFGVLCGYNANNIGVYDDLIYCVTVNKGSLVNTISPENNHTRFDVRLRYNTFKTNVLIANTTLSDFVYIGSQTRINNATIGKFCSIGPNVSIGLGKHPTNFISSFPAFYSTKKQCQSSFTDRNYFKEFSPIHIGNDVWIGANVTILDGVEIGDGVIIAAGSVVTKSIEPYAIVGGIPSKLIKKRFDDVQISKLLNFKWWDKSYSFLSQNHRFFNSPNDFFKIIDNF